jgi:hypothetical protein
MTRKSHHDDTGPERAHEIEEELHNLDKVEASLQRAPQESGYEPATEPLFGQPTPEGADVGTADMGPPPEGLTPLPLGEEPMIHVRFRFPHEDVNQLMAGWWKEVKQMTLAPTQTGDHFMAYAAARGWQLVEAPTPKER